MLLGPRVRIAPPDAEAWARAFPNGLGVSAFSSPVFQRLMLATAPGFRPVAVELRGSDQWFPALGRQDRVGRWELQVLPIGYDVMPVQRAALRQYELDAWVAALSTPWIKHFVWWLPPWHARDLAVANRRSLVGDLVVDTHDTYVITLRGSVEDHLAQHVGSTMRRYARRNVKHGVQVRPAADDAEIEAYIAVYERSYRDNEWVGKPFSREFFYGVAHEMGEGGQLAVVLHEGRVIGGGILMIDPSVIHYFQGAIDRDVKDVHPHVALYMHALELAEARGIDHINLGGINDGNEGLARFKTAWGAVATPSPRLMFSSGPRRLVAHVREALPLMKLLR